MKISTKKSEELYNAVHEEIMGTRIKIARLLNFNPAGKEIDNLLSDLLVRAPQMAINCFNSKSVKPTEYPEYKEFLRIWDERYHELGLDMPKDGNKIKSIIRKTREYIKSAGGDPSDNSIVIYFWEKFVGSLHKTWAHGKNLSVVDSHYTSIIFEIKHGPKKQSYANQPSVARIIQDL